MYPPLKNTPTSAIRRRHASILVQMDLNFFDVARAYGIAPRVLLAWLAFENGRWENDATLGVGRGPDESYVGDWPTPEQEMDRYMAMGLTSKHFDDAVLRARYLKYRAQRMEKSGATSPISPKSRVVK